MSVSSYMRPQRNPSDDTKVDVELEDRPHSSQSNERQPRFSFNQASVHERPYKPAPQRRNTAPNLKGASPILPSQIGAQEESGGTPWRHEEPHRSQTHNKQEDSWRKCHAMAEKYDNELREAWRDEVDKLLIFAGLFSATVTAFVIESYKWLQEDTDDMSLKLLAFIAAQVANSSSTALPSALIPQPFSVSASEVRINSVWFLSLTLALTTVLIGILCLQWLREFQRDAALSHKDAVALRQMRYEGLLHWRVPDILSLLPILLSTSLVLFFFGLLELLWTRNKVVAVFITAAVGVAMMFLGVTTALPAVQYVTTRDPHLRVYQCPYKSPQSWIFYQAGSIFFFVLDYLHIWSRIEEDPSSRRVLRSRGDLNWLTFDIRWRRLRDAQEVVRGVAKNLEDSDDIIRGLQWLNATFSHSVEAIHHIHHAIADLELPAAATTVSGFYIKGQIDDATLRVMLDDRFSPTEAQKRDIVSAYYLNMHHSSHPALKTLYIETVTRILNSQDVPRPFYDWLSEILQELASPSSTSTQGHAVARRSYINAEIKVRVLLCVKNIISRRRALQTSDVVVAWALLHRLVAPSLASSTLPDEGSGVVPVCANTQHLKLACALFEEFEMWIQAGNAIERWERVKLCAEGMLTVFGAAPDMMWLQGVCPDIYKARSLVCTLGTHFATLGGPEEVLTREQWWLDYWDGYNEADWNRLTHKFREIDDLGR